MTVIRILGACAVIFSGISAAHLLNRSAKRSVSQLEGLVSFVRFLRSEIECFAMPLPKILSRCPSDIRTLCGCEAEGITDISEFFRECGIEDAGSRAAMERFCQEIGRGYRDDRLALCDYYISLLDERRQTLSAALVGRRKTNGALCVAGALALVIILV